MGMVIIEALVSEEKKEALGQCKVLLFCREGLTIQVYWPYLKQHFYLKRRRREGRKSKKRKPLPSTQYVRVSEPCKFTLSCFQ